MVLQRSSPHANGVFGKTRPPGLLTTGMRRVTGRIVERMRGIASDKSSLQRRATIYLGKMVMGVVGGLGGGINHPDSGSEIVTAIVTDHAGLGHAQDHRIDIGEDDLGHEALNDLINGDDEIDAYIILERVLYFYEIISVYGALSGRGTLPEQPSISFRAVTGVHSSFILHKREHNAPIHLALVPGHTTVLYGSTIHVWTQAHIEGHTRYPQT